MNISGLKEYAIYGGTFDPVHTGHVALADHAVRECGLHMLIFMPAYVSPFKKDRNVTDGRDRYEMLRCVLGLNKAFRLSGYELSRPEPSYTYETLEHWSSLLNGRLSFVLGFDSVVQADTWYRGIDILSKYRLITARRPDTDDDDGLERIEYFRHRYNAEITVLNMEPVDASSTEIRSLTAEGRPLGGLVPAGVEEYIIEHGLYGYSRD